MYYSKTDNIIYISNPIEKLFIEKKYVDHITNKGTIRHDFIDNGWIVIQQLIKLENNEFWLPIRINNDNINFVLDTNQALVTGVANNFTLSCGITTPNIKHYLIKPNAFFLLLKIIQTWEDITVINSDANFFLSTAAKIEDTRLLHCKLIYHQSQRITL